MNYWYDINISEVGANVPTDWTESIWTKLDSNNEIVSKIKQALAGNCSRIVFDGLAKSHCNFDNSDCYIAAFSGGFNGGGPDKWSKYLSNINHILKYLNADIVTLENDCADDIWYLTIVF